MPATSPRVGFVSLGCPKALVDSERILTQLRIRGYEISPSYEGSDLFVLHGPFAVGTELDVTPEGQETFRSTIVELVENELYADSTSYNGLGLLFRHTLTPEGTGTRVTHTLEISGDAADAVGPELGPQISGDFDVSMAALFAEAAKLSQ